MTVKTIAIAAFSGVLMLILFAVGVAALAPPVPIP